MDIPEFFGEQARYTAWADAVVLSAILGDKGAMQDVQLLTRLRHQHLVQRAFLDFWQGKPIDHRLTQSLGMSALASFARDLHADAMRFHESVGAEELQRVVDLPSKSLIAGRLGFEPGDATLAQTFQQVFAHSSYHRGQVCARLRELGIDPPMTDFIVWIWAHKPDPSWP